jgi:hypothetical protein
MVVQGLYHLVLCSEKTCCEQLCQRFLYREVRKCSSCHVRDAFFDLVYIFLEYPLFILSLYNDVIVFLHFFRHVECEECSITFSLPIALLVYIYTYILTCSSKETRSLYYFIRFYHPNLIDGVLR